MQPTTIAELQSIVRQHPRLLPRGGGSKTALSAPDEATTQIDLINLSGMLEYQPDEYTFTALAGTPLREINPILAENRQYLPFDPPLAGRGATLGGTVAAGLSGTGRYRYGGIRDFLLGVRFVDGQGQLIRSGGKVVKNVAGFDLARLMIGSLGQYGALTELSFKVFPRPPACVTLQISFPELSPALDSLTRLTRAPLELYSLDLIPGAEEVSLLVRLGGQMESFPQRIARTQRTLGNAETLSEKVIEGEQEAELWQQAGEFAWLPEASALVKIPLTPARLPALDAKLAKAGALRRYSVGANLAWVGWPGPVDQLEAILKAEGLSGLVVLGSAGRVRLGVITGASFEQRVKQALDPMGKFASLPLDERTPETL